MTQTILLNSDNTVHSIEQRALGDGLWVPLQFCRWRDMPSFRWSDGELVPYTEEWLNPDLNLTRAEAEALGQFMAVEVEDGATVHPGYVYKDGVLAPPTFTPDAPDPKEPRVLDLAPGVATSNFHTINYVSSLEGRLHPKLTFHRGVLVEKVFYKDLSVDPETQVFTYTQPVVRETFAYQRDVKGFAQSRLQTIQWVNRDGTYNDRTKTRVKVYTPQESIGETHRRRSNILDQMQVEMLALLQAYAGMTQAEAIAEGQSFYSSLSTEIALYRDIGEHTTLWQSIWDMTGRTWLDAEIAPSFAVRDHLISRIREIEPT